VCLTTQLEAPVSRQQYLVQTDNQAQDKVYGNATAISHKLAECDTPTQEERIEAEVKPHKVHLYKNIDDSLIAVTAKRVASSKLTEETTSKIQRLHGSEPEQATAKANTYTQSDTLPVVTITPGTMNLQGDVPSTKSPTKSLRRQTASVSPAADHNQSNSVDEGTSEERSGESGEGFSEANTLRRNSSFEDVYQNALSDESFVEENYNDGMIFRSEGGMDSVLTPSLPGQVDPSQIQPIPGWVVIGETFCNPYCGPSVSNQHISLMINPPWVSSQHMVMHSHLAPQIPILPHSPASSSSESSNSNYLSTSKTVSGSNSQSSLSSNDSTVSRSCSCDTSSNISSSSDDSTESYSTSQSVGSDSDNSQSIADSLAVQMDNNSDHGHWDLHRSACQSFESLDVLLDEGSDTAQDREDPDRLDEDSESLEDGPDHLDVDSKPLDVNPEPLSGNPEALSGNPEPLDVDPDSKDVTNPANFGEDLSSFLGVGPPLDSNNYYVGQRTKRVHVLDEQMDGKAARVGNGNSHSSQNLGTNPSHGILCNMHDKLSHIDPLSLVTDSSTIITHGTSHSTVHSDSVVPLCLIAPPSDRSDTVTNNEDGNRGLDGREPELHGPTTSRDNSSSKQSATVVLGAGTRGSQPTGEGHYVNDSAIDKVDPGSGEHIYENVEALQEEPVHATPSPPSMMDVVEQTRETSQDSGNLHVYHRLNQSNQSKLLKLTYAYLECSRILILLQILIRIIYIGWHGFRISMILSCS
jgi:hypothetical protein